MTPDDPTTTTTMNFYRQALGRHGLTPQGLGWTGGAPSQWRRFEVITSLLPSVGSVIDVGCGFGDFAACVAADRYRGIDIIPEYIVEAKRRRPMYAFDTFDVRAAVGQSDYIVASGVFGTGWQDDVFVACWQMCGRAFVFNALSMWAGEKEGAHRLDPLAVLNRCHALTSKVRLVHDYMPHDFTVAMYR